MGMDADMEKSSPSRTSSSLVKMMYF